MTLPAGPKIDCHIHAIDPVRFPYADDTPYRPSGQEIAPAAQLLRVFDVFDVRHALVVATNTGYGSDSRILLDTLAQGGGRLRGVAVVNNDVDIRELERLKAAGIIGVAYNVPFHGADYYCNTAALLDKLENLDLFLQIQVENARAARLRAVAYGAEPAVSGSGRSAPAAVADAGTLARLIRRRRSIKIRR